MKKTENMIQMTKPHIDFAKKKRRIVVQNDAMDFPKKAGVTDGRIEDAVKLVFDFADHPDSQIDAMIWDIEMNGMSFKNMRWTDQTIDWVQKQLDQGVDFVDVFIKEGRKRGLDNFWNHRINDVDFDLHGSINMECLVPPKAAHQHCLTPSWYWQGFWDFSKEETHTVTLSYLEEIMMLYDLDGMQIDFMRHTPYLPIDAHEQNRSHVTSFMEKLRRLFCRLEKVKQKPLLLGARIPKKLSFCLQDGLEPIEWMNLGLVDFLLLGSRSVKVDVRAFAEAAKGKNVQLYPCFDDHHATDGYRYADIEMLRGTFDSWHKQGASGVAVFNWSNASKATYEAMGYEYPEGSQAQEQAYRQIGSAHTMVEKNKTFVEERRGGYPWASGVGNTNMDCKLPVLFDERPFPMDFDVYCSEYLEKTDDSVRAYIRLVLYSARVDDTHKVTVNGHETVRKMSDPNWKDPQIFSPKPQPHSGGDGRYVIDAKQSLLMIEYEVPKSAICQGNNKVTYQLIRSGKPYGIHERVKIEKIELHIRYTPKKG